MTNNEMRGIMEEMRAAGWFEFGAVVDEEDYRRHLGIKYPETGTKKDFDTVALQELGAIDFIRSQLLNEGKYLKHSGGSYRVLLPSENITQMEAYMKSADNKLKRAIKLGRNSPKEGREEIDHCTVRAIMKQKSMKA